MHYTINLLCPHHLMKWAAALTVTDQVKVGMKLNYHEAWPPGEANRSWVSFFTLNDKYNVLLAHSLLYIRLCPFHILHLQSSGSSCPSASSLSSFTL